MGAVKSAKGVILEGEFTTQHLRTIAALLRSIEQSNPKKLYKMHVLDPDVSNVEAAQRLHDIFPFMGDLPVDFAHILFEK